MKDKKFYQYVIPSIGAMLVTGLYVVVDGIFVGQGTGPSGLAAINLAAPFVTILAAVSLMITMGGATNVSVYFGHRETETANQCFNLSMLMVLAFSLFMSVISVAFPEPIARMMGASGALVQDTAAYIRYYVLFGIFFCSSTALSAFVRNDGNPRLAFWGMISGAISNILLDWLFIFPLHMGVTGAAIASGLGQVLACLILSTHFIRKMGKLTIALPRFDKNRALQILKTGAPEFITQMNQPVTILCYNLIVLKMFGEIGVSAFSVVTYILIIAIGVFSGLAQGLQPLLSLSLGEGKRDQEQYYFRKGLRMNILLAALIYVAFLLFGKGIISIFNNNTELIALGYACIRVYGISFLFAAANVVYTTYFLSTKRTRQALLLSTLRSFIANSVFIFLMPALFGKAAVWTGMIAAEFVVLLVALFLARPKKSAAEQVTYIQS